MKITLDGNKSRSSTMGNRVSKTQRRDQTLLRYILSLTARGYFSFIIFLLFSKKKEDAMHQVNSTWADPIHRGNIKLKSR